MGLAEISDVQSSPRPPARLRRTPDAERKQDRQLCRRVQNQDPLALDELITRHGKVVRRLARKYLRAGVDPKDLEAEGSIGLIRAARKYDPKHGLPFVPYATWWIKQAMIMFLIQHGQGVISLPIRKVQLLKRLRREESTAEAALGRKPELEELAERLGRPVEELREVRECLPKVGSWEDLVVEPSDEGDHTAQEAMDRVRTSQLRKDLDRSLAALPDRDRRGVELFFGLKGPSLESFAELGRALSMTREGARQLVRRSLTKIRRLPEGERLARYLDSPAAPRVRES